MFFNLILRPILKQPAILNPQNANYRKGEYMKNFLVLVFGLTLAGSATFAQNIPTDKDALKTNIEETKKKIKEEKEQVNNACTADAKTAGCEGKVVGEGLMKCLFDYKKSHKDFKISDGCKTAAQDLRKNGKEMHEKMKGMHEQMKQMHEQEKQKKEEKK